MSPISHASHYLLLLKTFRAQGIKIIHRKLGGAGGLYCPKTSVITIGSEYKDTLLGCYFLCHEVHHRKQSMNNKFPDFFCLPAKSKFDEKTFELIMEAEMDAVKGGAIMLKMFGIPFSPPELTEDGFEYAKRFWKDYYFK